MSEDNPQRPTGRRKGEDEAQAAPLPQDQTSILLKIAETMAAAVATMQSMALPKDAMRDILGPIVKEVGETVSRARWPENTEHPHISAYFTEADQAKYGDWTNKPKLTRETFFCGHLENEDALSPTEIELYNAITEPRRVRGGAWRAEIELPQAQGAQPKLFVWVPANTVDQRMMVPSLSLILHELNGGPSSENVMDLLAQIDRLKRELAAARGVTAEALAAELLKQ
jgi:hypothetical protein